MKFDYKYIIALFLSFIGIALTIWYANVPTDSKSLSMNVLSKGLLNVVGESKINGLKVFIDDYEINKPALTVLTLKNTGTVPIRSTDFESDIVIIIDETVKLIRASVIKSEPEWLNATISVKESKAYFSPVLLNPNESVTINIFSEGLPKSVSTRSRIAGIKEIITDESEKVKKNQTLSLIKLGGAFLTAISLVSIYSNLSFTSKSRSTINKPTLFTVVIILTLVVQFLMFSAIEDLLGIEGFWEQIFSFFVMVILASPLSSLLNRIGVQLEK